jgi:hypothetical protein
VHEAQASVFTILNKPPNLRQPNELHRLLNYLREITFFRDLAQNVHLERMLRLCQAISYKTYSAGQTVVKYGDVGDQFFVIL